MRAALFALVSALTLGAAPGQSKVLAFADLDGWVRDDHPAALRVFLRSCDRIDAADWAAVCALARDVAPEAARSFFELFFRPVVIGAPPALFTGYFEPELAGSPVRTPRFSQPVYRRPSDAETAPAAGLQGRGLELAWVEPAADLAVLQLQGSGRIRLPDGQVLRVGYAGQMAEPFQAIGAELVRRGLAKPGVISAKVIEDWIRRFPLEARALASTGPRALFFRRIPDLALTDGPLGAMARSVTPMRSIAVDPAFVPLGAPVWLEKDGAKPLRRLMIAQDTGGAIKGAQRADIFYGTGADAGRAAGQIRDSGRIVVLLPIDRAYTMLPDG